MESVIKKLATASASMDGQDPLVNFYAHSVSLAATVPNGATAKTEPVVTVRREDASVYLGGVESIVRNLAPVDTMGQSARTLVNVRMERFVMR